MGQNLETSGKAKPYLISVLCAICKIVGRLSEVQVRWAGGRRFLFLFCLGMGMMPQVAIAAKCLFISSNHRGTSGLMG
jgi:hypothetical protein